MNKQKLRIVTNEDTWDCECCGFITDISFKAFLEKDNILSLYCDGHFGKGNWDGEWDTAYAWLAAKLGIVFKINGEINVLPEFFENTTGYQNITPTNPIVVDVEIKTRDISVPINFDGNSAAYSYLLPVEAYLSMPSLLSEKTSNKTLISSVDKDYNYTQPGWCGEWSEFYLATLENYFLIEHESVCTQSPIYSEYEEEN